jgi:hypothetical protein
MGWSDWQNHFAGRAKERFKERFRAVLIEIGYKSTDGC